MRTQITLMKISYKQSKMVFWSNNLIMAWTWDINQHQRLATIRTVWSRTSMIFHLERPNRTWLDTKCKTLIYISEDQQSTKNQTIMDWTETPKPKDIGPRLRTRSLLKLLSSIRERTGRRLLRPLKVELMFSACTGGKRCWTQILSKDHGLILRIDFYCS